MTKIADFLISTISESAHSAVYALLLLEGAIATFGRKIRTSDSSQITWESLIKAKTIDIQNIFNTLCYGNQTIPFSCKIGLNYDISSLIEFFWSDLTFKQQSSWIYRSAGTPVLLLSRPEYSEVALECLQSGKSGNFVA